MKILLNSIINKGIQANKLQHNSNLESHSQPMNDKLEISFKGIFYQLIDLDHKTVKGLLFDRDNIDTLKANYADLSKSHFSFAKIKDMSATGANLEDSDFTNAEITTFVAAEADLNKAKFIGAKIKDMSATGANLEDSDFTNAEFDEIDLQGAKLKGAIGLDTIKVNNTLTLSNYTVRPDGENATEEWAKSYWKNIDPNKITFNIFAGR